MQNLKPGHIWDQTSTRTAKKSKRKRYQDFGRPDSKAAGNLRAKRPSMDNTGAKLTNGSASKPRLDVISHRRLRFDGGSKPANAYLFQASDDVKKAKA